MRSHELLATQTWLLATLPQLLVALCVVVLTPLALTVAAAPRRLVRATALAGALAAGALLGLAPGPLALGLALPYAVTTACAGALGVARLAAAARPAARVVMGLGLLFLPAAACWLVAACAGYPLLGYPPFWVVLTAAHFHVAGAYLPLVLGRRAHLGGRYGDVAAVAFALAVPMTALGIHGPRWLEVAGALATAASAAAAAVALVAAPLGAGRPLLARGAGAGLLVTMALAGWFALRDVAPPVSLLGLGELASMMLAHAAPNVLLVGLLLFAYSAGAPLPSDSRLVASPPLSRLRAGGHVGADFLDRAGLVQERARPPTGLVDDLAELAHRGLDPSAVDGAVRAFYEHTAAHEMIVEPSWRAGVGPAARVWTILARRLGQLQLPGPGSAPGQDLASRIVAVDAEADGRAAPRSWIRTYPDGRALYVAVYSTHRWQDRAYMNIAFPLPGGNLSSVLRMDGRGGGVIVSTRAGGDCGIYFVWRVGQRIWPLRLPLSETIEVWTTADPAAPEDLRAWGAAFALVARHTLWLLGVRVVTLRYAMRRKC